MGCSYEFLEGGERERGFSHFAAFREQHGAGLGERDKKRILGRHACMIRPFGLEDDCPHCKYVCQRNDRMYKSHELNPPIPSHGLVWPSSVSLFTWPRVGVSRIVATDPPLARRAVPPWCDHAILMQPAYVKRIEFRTLDRGERLAKSRNTAAESLPQSPALLVGETDESASKWPLSPSLSFPRLGKVAVTSCVNIDGRAVVNAAMRCGGYKGRFERLSASSHCCSWTPTTSHLLRKQSAKNSQ